MSKKQIQCKKCETVVDKKVKYCPNCGEKIVNKAKSKGLLITLVIFIVFVLIAALGFAGYLRYEKNRRVVIDLNQFVEVSYSGYDTIGDAIGLFRWDKLEEQYAEELTDILTREQNLQTLMNYLKTEVIKGRLTEEANLSNNQTIQYVWDCRDEEMLEETYRVVLQYSDIPVVVTGLTEIEYVDIFEKISVDFSGIEPYGKATISGDTKIYDSSFRFVINNTTDLSNGKKVTVEVKYTGGATEDSVLRKYGIKVSEMSKEFEVTGLRKYVNYISQIPEDTLNKMINQGVDVYTKYAQSEWIEGQQLQDIQYQGCYMMTAKSPKTEIQNRLYIVYKVTAVDNFPKAGVYKTFEYYTVIEYDNIIKLYGDTSPVTVNLNDWKHASLYFTREVKTGNYGNWEQPLSYIGYADMDALYQYVVTNQLSSYKYQKNFSDGR